MKSETQTNSSSRSSSPHSDLNENNNDIKYNLMDIDDIEATTASEHQKRTSNDDNNNNTNVTTWPQTLLGSSKQREIKF